MNAMVFVDRINGFAARHAREWDFNRVGVQTICGGCPTYHISPVREIGLGTDWDHGWLILYPQDALVVAREVPDPKALGAKTIDELTVAYKRIGQEYLPRLRRECWIDGFTSGIERHATACGNVKAP